MLDVIKIAQKPIWVNRQLRDLAEFWKGRWAIPRSKNTESWTEESRATPTDPAAGCGLFGREEEALQGVA